MHVTHRESLNYIAGIRVVPREYSSLCDRRGVFILQEKESLTRANVL